MPLDAIIFDMDGVLVDSEVYWYQARLDYAAARGKVWTEADQRAAMGRGTVEWAEVMKERMRLEESLEAVIDEMLERMKALYSQRLPLRAGALEAVRLAASRTRCGLASGSPTALIQHVMKVSGLDAVFEEIVYGDDIPNGKPAPDIYIEALRRFDARPSHSLGIEDSANGIRALKAAGMMAVAAPSPDFPLAPDVAALADAQIDTLEDFTAALLDRLTP
jgi:HAD superfamily hydrolase (TIGR01509 family)